jgi:hypothetical protein
MRSSSLQYVLLLVAGCLVSDTVARIRGSGNLQPVTDTDLEQPVRGPLFLRKLKNGNGGAKKQGQQEVGLGKAVKKNGRAKTDKAAKEVEVPKVPKAKAERKHKLTMEEMIESGKGRPEGILVMHHVNNLEKEKQPGNATPKKAARKKKLKGEQV